MQDLYETHVATATMPAAGAFEIVPDDDNDLLQATRGIYVGVGGDLVVELIWGGVVTFRHLPDATLLPIRARKVLASSTAGSIVGLY
ncbi:MAG TPA: hypothetical protein VL147_07300 [Devosia sp.]|nr:hypothetical protein [Devosia sp.]